MQKRTRKKAPRDPNEPRGEGVLDQRTEPYYGKRGVSYSISERIRERIHPDLIIEFWAMILEGKTPIWIKSHRGIYRVEPDPNPLLPSPTLEQRSNAIKELNNRGWGLPVQSLQIDAHLKASIQNGIPEHLLKQVNYSVLADIQNAFKRLEDGNTQDAEWSPVVELQEPCQVTEATNVPVEGELQEPGQVDLSSPSSTLDLQEPCPSTTEVGEKINEE